LIFAPRHGRVMPVSPDGTRTPASPSSLTMLIEPVDGQRPVKKTIVAPARMFRYARSILRGPD